ncbi:MAG: DUF4136 domain-containing protein [Bacteroidota bacterium]
MLKIFLAILILLWMFGCSPGVHVDRDETVNMSTFQTYKFVDDEPNPDPNPLYRSSLLDNAIHSEIARQLEKRALNEDNRHPDVLIAYHTFTQQKQQSVNNYYPMMYGGWGWRYYPLGLSPYPYGYWNGYQQTYQYTEGTLIVDVINAKTKVLVWRGSVSDAVSDPSDLHRKAVKAVDQVFTKFPLKVVKHNDQPAIASHRN